MQETTETNIVKTHRIDICDNTYWVLVIAIVAIGAILFLGIASHFYTVRNVSAFTNGYEESVVPGSTQAIWTKTKK